MTRSRLCRIAAISVIGAALLSGCADRVHAPADVARGQAVELSAPAVAIPRLPVQSTALNSVGYDESRKILAVEFHGGEVYEYYDVPAQVYHDLMAAASKGRYFHRHIRDAGYKYDRK